MKMSNNSAKYEVLIKQLPLLNPGHSASPGEQACLSGESAHFPPMCLSSVSARCNMWVEFVVDSPLLRGFFARFSSKTNISMFQIDLDRRPACKPAEADVAWSLNIVINLFPVIVVMCSCVKHSSALAL